MSPSHQELLDAYILDYLQKKNLHTSAGSFQAEANVQTSSVDIDDPDGFLLQFWSFFWDVYSALMEMKGLEEAARAAQIERQQIKDPEQHLHELYQKSIRPLLQEQQRMQNILLEAPGATIGGQLTWQTLSGAPCCVLQGNLQNVQNWNQQHLGFGQQKIFLEATETITGGHPTWQALPGAPFGVLQENFQNFQYQNQQHLEYGQAYMNDLVGDGSLCISDSVLEGFTLEEVQLITEFENMDCCHFSPDGKLLATGGHNKMASLYSHCSYWPVPFKFNFIVGVHYEWITDIRFRPSMPRIIATSSADKTVKIWNVDTPRPPSYSFTGHSETVLTLDFHPGKVNLLFSSDYRVIRCWNITNRECTIVKVSKLGINQIRFEPSIGKFLAVAANNFICILDGETLAEKDLFKGHIKDVHSVCWHSSGEFLASVSDDSVRVWRVSEGKCVYKLETIGKKFNTCVFHPSHDCSLIIGCHKTLEIWNFLQNKLISVPAHDGLVSSLAASNVTGTGFVASASHDKHVKLWK